MKSFRATTAAAVVIAGCDGLAKAIAEGKAPVNACPVGGAPVGEKIAAIMGVEAGASEKKVAFVKCKGTCDKTKVQYNYHGIEDCAKASVVPGWRCKGMLLTAVRVLVPA